MRCPRRCAASAASSPSSSLVRPHSPGGLRQALSALGSACQSDSALASCRRRRCASLCILRNGTLRPEELTSLSHDSSLEAVRNVPAPSLSSAADCPSWLLGAQILGALAAVHSCMGGGRRPRFHGDDAYTRWPVALNCVGQYPSQGQSKRRVVTAGRRSATRGGAAQGAPLASRPRRRDERGPPPLRARAVASPRSVLGAGRRGGGAEGRPRPRVQPGLLTPRPRRPRRRPARLHRRPRWRGGPWSPCTPGHGKRRLAAPSPRSAPRPLRGSAA